MVVAENNSELLTLTEASAILRLRPSTLRSWVLKRRIQFVKLGGKVFLRKADCDALILTSLIPKDETKGDKSC
jgi:excisionase family DNA binding protein